MDKVLSARVDEAVLGRIGHLARHLHTSKKAVIENAVRLYAAQVDQEHGSDVFEATCGVWHRQDSAAEVVDASRRAFRKSMTRRPR